MIAERPLDSDPARCEVCGWSYYQRADSARVLHLPDGRHRVVPALEGSGARATLRQARVEVLAMASRLHEHAEDLDALLRLLDGYLDPE